MSLRSVSHFPKVALTASLLFVVSCEIESTKRGVGGDEFADGGLYIPGTDARPLPTDAQVVMVDAEEATPDAAEATPDATEATPDAKEVTPDAGPRCGNGVVELAEACDDGNPVEGDGCDSNCTVTGCGNRIVTGAEQCDDGGTAGGDCCSGACQFEAGGSLCDDADACTNADACDGAGACVGLAAPQPLCTGAASGQASLVLKDATNDGGDTLVWKLRKGGATSPVALGDPRATDGYTLCLYDAAALPQPRLAAALPSGSDWRASGAGFAYRSASRAPDGIASAKLAPGAASQTKLLVKGKGGLLDLPPLAGLTPPLTVQLRGPAGGCWGAAYSTPTAATATLFKARSD
mgnify:CR=1 FL=1